MEWPRKAIVFSYSLRFRFVVLARCLIPRRREIYGDKIRKLYRPDSNSRITQSAFITIPVMYHQDQNRVGGFPTSPLQVISRGGAPLAGGLAYEE